MGKSFNPILPLYEYIPDGEPHVFEDRIYLYGSHDTEGGKRYCAEENYVGWSAPVNDPTNWRYEGEIYNAKCDPDFKEGEFNDMYAPDVVKGNDGRYYLYYGLSSTGHGKLNVAVSNSPTGRYEYLGFVKNPDGSVHNTYLVFDPALINDNGKIRLYAGWSLSMVAAKAHAQGNSYDTKENEKYYKNTEQKQNMKLPDPKDPCIDQKLLPVYKVLFNKELKDIKNLKYPLMGANTIELEDDMLTVKGEPKRIVEGQFSTPKESSFYGHAFYEASSIRKIGDLYYFIYSSENSHELCYATSKYPDRDFVYGGTIISNGDIGYNGLKKENKNNMTANNHGSIERINNQWYVFYHRHTHKTTFSRQACVEPIEIKEDGSIPQVECTSMGFSKKPFNAKGEFPAAISCVLTNGNMPHCTNTSVEVDIPYITHEKNEHFITAIKNGTKIGYKYFEFFNDTKISLETRGIGKGYFEIRTNEEKIGKIFLSGSKKWKEHSTTLSLKGIKALFFIYHGEDTYELLSFKFEN